MHHNDELVKRLQDLIRFNTTNPPGAELPLARYIESAFREEGIETTLVEPPAPAVNRAALLARIRGNGHKKPLMLMAHMDVVGVEPKEWSCAPFEGVIKDGFLYGRGAIDDKGMLAINMMTMLMIQRDVVKAGNTLNRDIVFLATSDEEAGGDYGMAWIRANHPEWFDVEFAINEGGRIRINPDGSHALLLQTAERTSHEVTVTAHGPAGHAAVPRPDNAIVKLANAITQTTRYNGSATISATMLGAGIRFNVIPASASALFNIRTKPGESIEQVVEQLVSLINDPTVEVAITDRGAEAPASDENSPMFHAIANAARELIPGLTVTPYLSGGVTDSAVLRRLGVQAYGILPFPLTPEDEGRMHAADERVPVDSLQLGLKLIYNSVLNSSL